MNRIIKISLIIVFIFFQQNLCFSSTLHQDEINVLIEITAFLDKKLSENDVNYIESYSQHNSTIIKALATTILYKTDQNRYRDDIFSIFAVHDYVLRSTGQYNMVHFQDIIDSTKNIETQYSEFSDKRIFLLILFDKYKDQNKWFTTKDQRLSTARFFRTAFFAGVFNGTNIDALELADTIDQITEKNDLTIK